MRTTRAFGLGIVSITCRLRLKRHQVSSRSESGATMLEMAMVAPVFFLLLFGFIDIARYWQAKAGLSHAAQEAADALVVNPALKTGSVSAAKTTAETAVKERAKQLVLSNADTVNSSIFIPPSPDLYESMPVEVDVSVRFEPLLPIVWSDSILIQTKVAAFIEPLKTTSEPIPTDCFGRLFDAPASQPGVVPIFGVGCPCEKGDLSYGVVGADDTSEQCVCSSQGYPPVGDGTVDTSGNCGCPPGSNPVVGFDWSFMATQAGWTEEAIQAANASSTICCGAGYAQECPGNQIHPADVGRGVYSCACGCGDEATLNPDTGLCQCNNANEGFQSVSSDGPQGCNCNITSADCKDSSTFVEDKCECKCASSKREYDRGSEKCVCAAAVKKSCTDSGGTFDDSTCNCSCGTKKLSGNACICPKQAASACEESGGVVDPTTCACSCPAGSGVLSGNECTCPGGLQIGGKCECGDPKVKTWQGNSCKCSPDAVANCSGSLDPVSCGCNCADAHKTAPTPGAKCECLSFYRDYCVLDYYSFFTAYGYVPGTFNPETCGCGCPQNSTYVWDIICACDGGRSVIGGECKCPAGKKEDASKNCVCDTAPAEKQACLNSGGSLDYACNCSACQKGNEVIGGVCACNTPTKKSDGAGGCVCDDTTTEAQNCRNSGGQLDGNCRCSACPGGKVVINNVCACAPGLKWNGLSCDCDTMTGPGKACLDSLGTPNPLTCSCSCPGESRPDTANACRCPTAESSTCGSSGGVYNGDVNSCSCDCGQAIKTGEQCSCPNGGSLSGGVCNCGTLKKWDGASCACDDTKPSVAGCLNSPGGTLSPTSCGCTCSYSGQTFTANNKCECDSKKTLNPSNVCECEDLVAESEKCAKGGGVYDETKCECNCFGARWTGTECACADAVKMTYTTGSGCKCITKFKNHDQVPSPAPVNPTSCSSAPCPELEIDGICTNSDCQKCAGFMEDNGNCSGCPPE